MTALLLTNTGRKKALRSAPCAALSLSPVGADAGHTEDQIVADAMDLGAVEATVPACLFKLQIFMDIHGHKLSTICCCGGEDASVLQTLDPRRTRPWQMLWPWVHWRLLYGASCRCSWTFMGIRSARCAAAAMRMLLCCRCGTHRGPDCGRCCGPGCSGGCCARQPDQAGHPGQGQQVQQARHLRGVPILQAAKPLLGLQMVLHK